MYRDVYALKKFPDYVVKIERDMTQAMFANATEWRNYINNRYWGFVNDWMAPCISINHTGSLMVQRRVYWEGRRRKDYPKYVPAVFTDLKLRNFGWTSDDQFVCCDYSYMVVFPVAVGKKKMRYAKWWGTLRA